MTINFRIMAINLDFFTDKYEKCIMIADTQDYITVHLERDQLRGYGFSLRGGAEHGLGHFVSSVDQGSIADSQGIKAGDQFVRIDGLPLENATHNEAVAFISSRKKVHKE